MKEVEPKAVTQQLYTELHKKKSVFSKAQYDVLQGQKYGTTSEEREAETAFRS